MTATYGVPYEEESSSSTKVFNTLEEAKEAAKNACGNVYLNISIPATISSKETEELVALVNGDLYRSN